MKRTEVKSSEIHGEGLFAVETIHTGELIGLYEGGVVTSDVTPEEFPYVLWMEDDAEVFWGILGVGPTSKMNHDDDPNAVIPVLSPYIYARKRINPGDEITISYGEDWNPEDAATRLGE